MIVAGDGAVVSCFTEATSNSILPPASICHSGIGDWVTCVVLRVVAKWVTGAATAPTSRAISAAANATRKRSFSFASSRLQGGFP